MYAGLISHSDSSEEGGKEGSYCAADKREEDVVSGDDKEIGNELTDDPDFMASDDPPDEYQSTKK